MAGEEWPLVLIFARDQDENCREKVLRNAQEGIRLDSSRVHETEEVGIG